jgi:capsular polysaccharide transport system permease protein
MAESILRPIHVWLNVINALLLRDIRTRAGRFFTGYLFIFLMPFAHLAGLLIVFVMIMGKSPPFGTDPMIFFGLSVLPFVLFLYPSRQIVIAGLMLLFLFAMSSEFEPRDPFGMLGALLLTLYMGIAWGAYNSLIAFLAPFWAIVVNLVIPLLWIGSGIIMNVHGFPTQFRHWFAYNPLFQCVDYLRYSYYEGYPDELMDVGYVFWFATCLLAAAFLLERLLRRLLLSK